MEEKEYCKLQCQNATKDLERLEERINNVESSLQESFKGYKDYYNKKLEKLEEDIINNNNCYQTLNITIIKLDNTVNNLLDRVDKFIANMEENKKDTKMGFIYPIIASLFVAAITALAVNFIKFK